MNKESYRPISLGDARCNICGKEFRAPSDERDSGFEFHMRLTHLTTKHMDQTFNYLYHTFISDFNLKKREMENE